MTKRNVLVVDAEGYVGEQLLHLVADDLAYFFSTSVAEAKLLLHEMRFSVALMVISDHFLLQQEEVEQLIFGPSNTEWIALLEPNAIKNPEIQRFVVKAFHDYHTLPIDLLRLGPAIGHACGRSKLRSALAERQNEGHSKYNICGDSPAMRVLFARLEKVIHTDAPVLVGGETGTGKELVAQAIHRFSKRSGGPLVVVNCCAIPSNLIQSELFGYEKGAFTGATQRQIGKIEGASGGVLFLDEIGDLPLDMQASLLRVLQERTITRVGSLQTIPVNFRVVAATHVNLQEAVAQGRFREDLYYRLNVLHLELPPLRKRGNDVILLADAVFRKYVDVCKNRPVRGFSKEAMRVMLAYDWPGNVRELINRVQRAMVMSEDRLLSPADLGLDDFANNLRDVTLDHARASFDRDLLESSLRSNGNKVAKAARQLGVSRVTLYRMMNKFRIPLAHSVGQSE